MLTKTENSKSTAPVSKTRSDLSSSFLSLRPDPVATEEIVDQIYSDYMLQRALGLPVEREKLLALHPEYAEALRRQFEFEDALTCAGVDLPASTLIAHNPAPGSLVSAVSQPERVAKYTVVAALGKGSQATAYRVVHPDLQIEAVLKLAHTDATGKIGDLASEAQTLARISHDHLVKVLDAGVWNGQPYLVSEYVAGQTLDQWARHRDVSVLEAAQAVAKLARGIQVAHDVGICHLDIKPSNVVVGLHGELKLIDFGLALRREPNLGEGELPSAIGGTLQYMPPEQARAETAAIGPRSDVFALGGVLFYLLTRYSPVPPIEIAKAYKLAVKCEWQKELLDADHVPLVLKKICHRAMQPRPEDRFSSAAELAGELERFIAHSKTRPVVRRRFLIGGAAALAMATAAGIGFAMRDANPTSAATGMEVAVWDESNKQFRRLHQAWPLHSGDQVRVEATAPGDRNVAIFQYAAGSWRQLTAAAADKERHHRIAFPSLDARTATEIVGAAATDVLVMISHPSRMPNADDLPDLIDLPDLPPEKVLRINSAGSELVTIAGAEHVKSFGKTVTVRNAAAIVEDRVAAWQAKLPHECEVIEAVAYYHGE